MADDFLYSLKEVRRPGLTAWSTAKAGQLWSDEDERFLIGAWRVGDSVQLIAETLERTAGSILGKLADLGYVKYDSISHIYTYVQKSPREGGDFVRVPFKESFGKKFYPAPKLKEQKVEKQIMNVKTIETVTFINGVQACKLSDGEIFQVIKGLEVKKTDLESIKAKSKKIKAEIERIDAEVLQLVEYVDGR